MLVADLYSGGRGALREGASGMWLWFGPKSCLRAMLLFILHGQRPAEARHPPSLLSDHREPSISQERSMLSSVCLHITSTHTHVQWDCALMSCPRVGQHGSGGFPQSPPWVHLGGLATSQTLRGKLRDQAADMRAPHKKENDSSTSRERAFLHFLESYPSC